ncbi:Calx-beta domain-containing protein [Cystobacter fuscus]
MSDALIFEFDARIAVPGNYDFNARLVDPAGAEIVWASSTRALATGVHRLALSFSGQAILQHGVNGPYRVQNLSLYSSSVEDSILEAHTTAAYPVAAFESRAFSLESKAVQVHEHEGVVALRVFLGSAAEAAVTVQYATRSGSASLGADYRAASGTLTFAPGESVKTLEIPLLEDAVPEGDETFVLTLSHPVGARMGANSSATVTILANDKLSFSQKEYVVREKAGPATFTVVLNAPSRQTVKVDYATHTGSALAGTDYVVTQGTLTFAPGETQKTFQVSITEDSLSETKEDFRLFLSNPVHAATASPFSAMVYIPANDGVSLGTGWLEVPEGAGVARLTVVLNGPSEQTVTVDYATQDAGAKAGSDYTARQGTLTFAPGETQKTLEVPVLDDTEDERNEQFRVVLSNPSNASLTGNTRTTLSIVDDD